MKSLWAVLFCFAYSFIIAQESTNVLPWRQNLAYNSYLMRMVHDQFAERKQDLNAAISSKETMLKYRNECRDRYKEILGVLPERTQLNAQVVGVINQKGYRVEKIIYESLLHRHITSSLFIPEGKGPFAATLLLCGHGMNGKAGEEDIALPFVKNGIAVFVIDPFGQGERVQLIDETNKPLTRGVTTEHTLTNAGAELVGTSIAAIEYWDNVRAIDYLETRNDIDHERIACIGSSGGGTQTMYLIGLEPRIKAAVVCSFISQRERTFELQGASDGCQHIPYEGKKHLEIEDFLIMFAPKPILISSGLYDFVDYQGALSVYKNLQSVYKALNEADKIGMVSAEYGHGMQQPKREAAINWLRRWLLADTSPVKEETTPWFSEKELLCTKTGQTLTSFSDEQSIMQYLKLQSKQYAEQRNNFMQKDSSIIRNKIFELLGISFPLAPIKAEQMGVIKTRACDVQKIQLVRPGQIPVPTLVYIPEQVNEKSSVVVYLNESGKQEIANNEFSTNNILNRGDILLLADLRGYGETLDPLELNDAKYWNREYRNAMISLHVGIPILGQRVVDIFTILDFISADARLKNHSVKFIVNGSYCPAVIHAAYLDKRIANIELSRTIKSYEEFILNPLQRDMFTNVIYGVLQYYDLPNLVKALRPGTIRYLD